MLQVVTVRHLITLILRRRSLTQQRDIAGASISQVTDERLRVLVSCNHVGRYVHGPLIRRCLLHEKLFLAGLSRVPSRVERLTGLARRLERLIGFFFLVLGCMVGLSSSHLVCVELRCALNNALPFELL